MAKAKYEMKVERSLKMKAEEMQLLSDMHLAPFMQLATGLIGKARHAGGNMFRHQMDTLAILIDYGYIDSFTGNARLDAEYYNSISFDDYFKNYTEADPNRLLFSYMNHISVTPKNGYIPKKCLKKMTTADINSLNESYTDEELEYLNNYVK